MLFSPEALAALLTKHGASLSKTARSLGLSPQRVHQLMEAHGVTITKTVTIIPFQSVKAKPLQSVKGKRGSHAN